MKRVQGKIKDFVEPQAFDEVQNHISDLPRSLAAYRFTDATSDLLARWLDALADLPRGRGAARALAGVRGVGKSHTLAAFGALVAFPDLRSTVADPHVAASARRLLSRRYVVARVERGTRPALQEEIADALVAAIGGAEADWMVEPEHLLNKAASISGDPLVLVIDTAPGRETRVERDDGALIGALAAVTANVNVFIALALDDDIAGAEGPNVALAGTFQIDYLDPEHLYRIVDVHLFHKNDQARTAIHDIYLTLRNAVPGFNWSEPRFAAIYPVHPIIADIAPAVRFYAPAFAFLPFAAAAGARATNRPAHSLIALDEVFDRAEYDLRKAEDLKDAFNAYDQLATHITTQFPVMQRLQAKLVLKALFILSLDGRGSSARELGAAILIYDEASPDTAIKLIESMLTRFAEAAPPNSIHRSEEGGEVARYRFSISATAAFDAALAAAAQGITGEDASISELLRVVARPRFEDWPLTDESGGATTAAYFFVMWRGMGRRGRISWQAPDESASPVAPGVQSANPAPYDWEVIVLAPEIATGATEGDPALKRSAEIAALRGPTSAVWQPAPLSAEEAEVLRRLVVLRTDTSFFTNFGETTRTAERTHAALAERIWTRIYINNGTFVTGTGPHPFTEEARAAATLAGALAPLVSSLLESRYPQHPVFIETLGEGEVARLVGDLFGGANQTDRNVQELARLFAAPLGLASLRGGVFTLEAGDQALKQSWIRDVLAITDEAGGETVPLDAVRRKLGREPYGFLRETQHLILAALVAQRRIELVTANGDRIGRRTLDQTLRWDEITGIARAATLLHSAEELTTWARRLTNRPSLASIADPEARTAVRAALSEWLEGWSKQGLLEKFDALPDDSLTIYSWNLAAAVRKSFGSTADAVEAALADMISLEEGLQRVADAFADSPEAFTQRSQQLTQLTNFVTAFEGRERARDYLLSAEPTGVDEIERARRDLLAITDDTQSLFDQDLINRFDLMWQEFHTHYSDNYVDEHNKSVGASFDRRAPDLLTRSDEWREFEALSQLSIVNPQYWEETARMLDQARRVYCDLPVRQLLVERPTCYCSFHLAQADSPQLLIQAVEDLVKRGLEGHRRTLALWSKHLSQSLESLAQEAAAEGIAPRARALASVLAQGIIPVPLAPSDVQLIERALQKTSVPALRVSLPASGYGLLTRDDLHALFRQWLDDLPGYPAHIEVVSETDGNAG